MVKKFIQCKPPKRKYSRVCILTTCNRCLRMFSFLYEWIVKSETFPFPRFLVVCCEINKSLPVQYSRHLEPSFSRFRCEAFDVPTFVASMMESFLLMISARYVVVPILNILPYSVRPSGASCFFRPVPFSNRDNFCPIASHTCRDSMHLSTLSR